MIHFVLALTVNEILTFEVFYLDKGQGHGLQLLQWHISKSINVIFYIFYFLPRYDLCVLVSVCNRYTQTEIWTKPMLQEK